MLYELILNNEYNNQHIDYSDNIILHVKQKNIINQDFYDILYHIINSIKNNFHMLTPYYYLNKIKHNPIYFFIFKEIIDKFSLSNNCLLFSNSIENIESIKNIFNTIKICTKNKLCSHNKYIIHNYYKFIEAEGKNKYNTIIIHYEDYKSFIIQILVSLLLQNQNGTLIINIPSNTSNTFLSLINFLMKFYKITIIKPFATRIYTSERYLICENYKNNITNDFIKYINKCLHTIIETKTIFLINNDDMKYYYLKKIIHDNSIWGTYVLNLLNKNILDDDIEYSNNENKKIIEKWLSFLS
jgi:hypothetical protein